MAWGKTPELAAHQQLPQFLESSGSGGRTNGKNHLIKESSVIYHELVLDLLTFDDRLN